MRLFPNMRVAAFAALSLLSSPAWAEEGGGLPQLDTSLFPEQVFWLAISFGILYLLMSMIALPRVARTQDNRASVIAAELAAAQTANDAAKAATAQMEKALTEARAKATAAVGEMIARVKEESGERQATQERELSRRLHSAEESIAVTREAALGTIRGSAAELSAAVVEKILGRRAA